VRRVERIQHLEVVECLPQGVRARFVEGFRVVRISGRIKPSNLLKDNVEKLCLEELSRHRKFTRRWTSSAIKEHLSHFPGFIRRNGWSKFSEENSKFSVGCWISRRSKKVTVEASKGSKLRRGRTVDPSHEDRRIYT
jgi:hypothetical protein